MKQTPIQNSFNSGELSPLIEARTDLGKYSSGCQKLENAIPLVEGGAKKMPGTYFVMSSKYPDKKSRLVPFSFSTTQTYILEFGNLYIRVFRNGGLVVDGNGDPVEITTTYLEADLFELDVDTQSADVLYIFHRSYAPKKLSRTSDIVWTFTAMSITGTEDISKVSTIARVITDITKANPAVVTASNHGFVNGDQVYISSVAGMVEVNQQIYTVSGATGTTPDFDPSIAYSPSTVVKVGYTAIFPLSGGRNLIVSTPYAGGVIEPITLETNSVDTLQITDTPLTIHLADTTSAKNSANLIQTALQIIRPGWFVTEDFAYAANRPTSGISLTTTTSADLSKIYYCTTSVSASATNTSHFPGVEGLYWEITGSLTSSTFSLSGINSSNFNAYTYGGTVVKVVPLFAGIE